MTVITVNELAFDFLGAVSLVLVTAGVTDAGFTPKRHDLEATALTGVKSVAVLGLTTADDLANLMVNNGANGMNFNKVIPIILKYLL